MEKLEKQKFTVHLQTEGLEGEAIEVRYAETTDGLPYYICKIRDKEIQLRKDEKWEQIWGDLSAKQVDALGAEINKHIEP